MRRCIKCRKWKDESEFNIRDLEKGYLQSERRDCHRESSRDRYSENPRLVLNGNRAVRQKGKERAKEFVYLYLLEHPCVDCGVADVSVLTFDHIPGTKKYNIADMIQHGYGIATILKEIEKTDVVCFNCHMRREQNRRGYSRFGRFG